MRTILALQMATLLFASMTGMAATVEYQHPDLTIVAREEPLDVVLKSLGKEMRIYVTVPTGLNPVVNCDIQQQPVKQAFKNLLGDMSYSLEWEEKTGKLVGLTILAGGEGAAALVPAGPSRARSMEQAAPVPGASTDKQGAGTPSDSVVPPPMGGDDTAMAEHEVRMEAVRGEHEARMETERAEHEARLETERVEHEARMVEERAAQEVRMKEEVARHDAELEAELASEGLPSPQ
jgi:hypothetical protein